jgi:hypothetical protein
VEGGGLMVGGSTVSRQAVGVAGGGGLGGEVDVGGEGDDGSDLRRGKRRRVRGTVSEIHTLVARCHEPHYILVLYFAYIFLCTIY